MIADIHIHSSRMIPAPFRYLYNFKHRKNLLPPFPLATIREAGLNLAFLNAVGDPALTKFYSLGNHYSGLKKQVRNLKREISNAGCILYNNWGSIEKGIRENRPVCLLAVEGADFLESKLPRLEEIYDLGVRSLGLVHFSNNCAGHINTDVLTMVKRVKIKEIESSAEGLTEFGHTLIREMNSLGMVADLAHGSGKTLLDAVKISRKPIIVSHSGSRAIQDFSRYLTDEELLAMADRGGIIGLWPFLFQGKGMATMEDFIQHAKHIRDLIGSQHIAIGTDANGLPGAMAGYKYEKDIHAMGRNLAKNGFSPEEVSGIMGNNILHVLKNITG